MRSAVWKLALGLLGGMVLGSQLALAGMPKEPVASVSQGSVSGSRQQAASLADPLISLPFLENQGQLDKSIRYYTLTRWGLAYVYQDGRIGYSVAPAQGKSKGIAIHETLLGASKILTRGESLAKVQINHITSTNKAQRQPAFDRLSLGEVYPGVEVKLHATADNVEKVFYIDSQGKPEAIRIKPQKVKTMRVQDDGQLLLKTAAGAVAFSKPVAYQVQDGQKQFVDVAYNVRGDSYGFDVGSYDHSKTLVIDPVLATNNQGTAGSVTITDIKIGSANQVYVYGMKDDFLMFFSSPTTGSSYQATGYGQFLARLSADLQTLEAVTIIDGIHATSAMALDAQDNVYITGTGDGSGGLPVSGYSTTETSFDAYILKLDPTLSTVLTGTYFGGSSGDYGYAITIALSGDVCIGGDAHSANLPMTATSFDTTWGGGSHRINRFRKYYWSDAFVACFDSELTTLKGSSYVGGSDGDETVRALATDPDGNVFVVGSTGSTDLPMTADSYDPTYNGGSRIAVGVPWGDIFVQKFDTTLSNLLGATYLGGSEIDYGWGLAVDSEGWVYIDGDTKSIDFPTLPGGADTAGSTSSSVSEGVVAKFNNDLTSMVAMSFVGGGSNEGMGRLSLGNDGSVLTSGWTTSVDFPALQGSFVSSSDSFYVRLSRDLSTFLESELLGLGPDIGDSLGMVEMDANGLIYGAGYQNFNIGLTTYHSGRVVKLGAVDLGITMSDAPDPLDAGGVLTYTLSVHNYGVDFAHKIVATQQLPDHVNFLSATPSKGNCSESLGVVTCNINRLKVNGTVTIDVAVQTIDGGALVSSASVTAVEPDTQLANNSASAHTTVNGGVVMPDLAVAMTATPEPVVQGNTLSYQITVNNLSSVATTGVIVSDTLPLGVTALLPLPAGCGESAGVVTCDLGGLAGNASTVVTIDVSADSLGAISNSVSVIAFEGDLNPVDNNAVVNSTVVAPPSADVSLAMTAAPGTATLSADLVYTLSVGNLGPDAATNVVLVDTLPADATYVGFTSTQGSCAVATGVLSCSLGTLASGSSATVSITVTPTVAGIDLTNSAEVTSDTADADLANNLASAITPVVTGTGRSVDLQLSMFDWSDPVFVDEVMSYSLTINVNSGYSPTGVVLTVTLPPNSTFVSQGSNYGKYSNVCVENAGVLTCPLSNVNSWEVFNIGIAIIPHSLGIISASAEIHSDDPDPDVNNNSAVVQTSVIQSTTPADLAVDLSASAPSINMGETITYTAVVTNNGSGTANNVVLSDVLPPEFSYQSASLTQGSCGINAGTVSCNLGTLASGASATVDLTLLAVADGGVVNTVSVSADQSDPNTGNNSANIEIEIY